MKKPVVKIFFIALAVLTLSVSLCACGSAADAYCKAVEKYNEAPGVSSTGIMTVTMDGENRASISSSLIINNGENRQASLSVNSEIETGTDTPVQAVSEAYYRDGKYYMSFSGSKYYMTLDWENALSQMGVYGLALGFTDEDFEGIVVEESDEGDMISFVIGSGNSEKLTGISTQLSRIIPEATVKFDHIQGKIILDENGAPKAQHITVAATLDAADGQMEITENIDLRFELSEAPLAAAAPGPGYASLD